MTADRLLLQVVCVICYYFTVTTIRNTAFFLSFLFFFRNNRFSCCETAPDMLYCQRNCIVSLYQGQRRILVLYGAVPETDGSHGQNQTDVLSYVRKGIITRRKIEYEIKV